MKVTWIIFLILGVLLILINLPVYFKGIETPDIPDTTQRIAYFIGRNLALIVGSIFLLIAFFVNRKWRLNKQEKEQRKIIDSIGID